MPDPPNFDGMTAVEYSAWKESNPECQACEIGQAVVSATAGAVSTPDNQEVPVIPPTGHPPPHHTIPVSASGTADEAEDATEAGPLDGTQLGPLDGSQLGVEDGRRASEGEMAEESVGTRAATQEAEIPTIHGTLEPDVGADLPGYRITEADCRLDGIYGDHVHANDGTHLDGGIQDDETWQRRWKRVVQTNPKHYSLPKGKVGRKWLTALIREFSGVRERLWNSEKVVVFLRVTLQTTPNVRKAKDNRSRISQRLQFWEQGCYAGLVDDTVAEALSGTSPRARDQETEARAFNGKVLSG